jgi:hypothetical protein
MQAYQQRVVDEKKDLDHKLEKLDAFLTTAQSGGLFDSLPQEDKTLLQHQGVAMREYSQILKKRIARFQ